MEPSEIQQFYRNTHVLITGGFGFFGKLLTQKLLRECDGIEKIYLILRAKKGKAIQERMEDVYKNPVFNKLKETRPDFRNKIHLIEGDISHLKIGLKQSDIALLQENVNIVFHVAADLNMEAKLKDCGQTNVRGTKELLLICYQMKHLKAAVFVSTAFSNFKVGSPTIHEKFYKQAITAETFLKVLEEADDETIEKITPGLLGKSPNAYVFSKSLAEDIVKTHGRNMPVAVFRPTSVMCAHTDPLIGWTDNIYGLLGTVIGSSMGIIRMLYLNGDMKSDVIPADYCINALISAAWDCTAKQRNTDEPVPIYNFAAGLKNAVSNSTAVKELLRVDNKIPLTKRVWPAISIPTTNPYLYHIGLLFLHYLPGLFMDAYLFLSGKKPRMIKMYNKIYKTTRVLAPFLECQFEFKNDNVCSMWDRLSEQDRATFPFNMESFDWSLYMEHCLAGLKYYIVKEDPADYEKAKKHDIKLQKMNFYLMSGLFLLGVWIVYKLITFWF